MLNHHKHNRNSKQNSLDVFFFFSSTIILRFIYLFYLFIYLFIHLLYFTLVYKIVENNSTNKYQQNQVKI